MSQNNFTKNWWECKYFHSENNFRLWCSVHKLHDPHEFVECVASNGGVCDCFINKNLEKEYNEVK